MTGSALRMKVGVNLPYTGIGAEFAQLVDRGMELYLKLNVTQGDLTIEVPADNVDLVGVRDVIGKEGLDRVFEVLRAPFTEEPTNWSRRYKANLEKLASGDVIKVSEVVRDLWRRDQDRGLSAGEKRMLAKAKQILVSELTFALNVDEEAAEARLDDVLAGRDAPPPPKKKAAPKKAPAVKKAAPAEKAPAAATRAPASGAVKAKAPAEKAPTPKKAAPAKAASKTTKSAAK